MSVEDDVVTVRSMLDYPHETKYIAALEALDRIAILANSTETENNLIQAEIARLEERLLSGTVAESHTFALEHRIRVLRASLS